MKKTVYISILIGLFALLSFSVFHEEEERQPRFTIMGVGDSITEGGDYFTCYLFPLWEKLFTAGYTFDFIGPSRKQMPDRDVEAWRFQRENGRVFGCENRQLVSALSGGHRVTSCRAQPFRGGEAGRRDDCRLSVDYPKNTGD